MRDRIDRVVALVCQWIVTEWQRGRFLLRRSDWDSAGHSGRHGLMEVSPDEVIVVLTGAVTAIAHGNYVAGVLLLVLWGLFRSLKDGERGS